MVKTEKKAKKARSATNPVAVRLAYGVDEAAALLSVSRGKLYLMMGAKEIHSFKAGKRRLIPADALKTWLSRVQEAAWRCVSKRRSPPVQGRLREPFKIESNRYVSQSQ